MIIAYHVITHDMQDLTHAGCDLCVILRACDMYSRHLLAGTNKTQKGLGSDAQTVPSLNGITGPFALCNTVVLLPPVTQK